MSHRISILVKRFPKLSETFVLGEIASLVDKGMDLRIISLYRPNEQLLQPGSERLGHRVTYVEDQPPLRSLVSLFREMLRRPQVAATIWRSWVSTDIRLIELAGVLRICRLHGISHLHAHYISGPALIADVVSQLGGGTFSVSAHAKDIYVTPPAAVKARLNNAEFVATCTAHNHTYLSSLAVDQSRVHLVYHGIDSDRFKPAHSAIQANIPLVVAVGRYKEKKGFDLLIGACARLRDAKIRFRCEIIGYGDQQEKLQNLIDANLLQGDVQLRPPVNHEELTGILQRAAVCVLPCRKTSDGDRDGIPNSLLEAMACAIPIISTTVSGIPEVIRSGWNGLLVDPDDTDALANAMKTLLADGKLSRRLAVHGRETVTDKFCWQNNTRVLKDMLVGSLPQDKSPGYAS